MINNKSILAIIPARGGSKGLPNKNILKVMNKPLIAWTIEESLKSKYIDNVVVSTDDQNIANISKKYDVEKIILRPSHLASDSATTAAVLKYEINLIKKTFDLLILLQPTSPLRTVEDIDNAIEMIDKNNTSSLVSVSENKHPIEWIVELNKKNMIKKSSILNSLKIRQDSSNSYRLNGAIYISYVRDFLKNNSFFTNNTLAFIMPEHKSIDIDDKHDFKIASLLMYDRDN